MYKLTLIKGRFPVILDYHGKDCDPYDLLLQVFRDASQSPNYEIHAQGGANHGELLYSLKGGF